MTKPAPANLVYEAPIRDYQVALELAGRAPRPAAVGRVLCGTAGWTDPTLLKGGLFYPKSIKRAAERLAYYAQSFPYVEVDATYYALLPPAQARQWLASAPPSFVFDIKAHPVLTGQPFELKRLPADLREALERTGAPERVYADQIPVPLRQEIEGRFREFLQPLIQAGRLSSVLVQFPPWFVQSDQHRNAIVALAERWQGVPLAVEFRHPSWVALEHYIQTLELLERLGLSWVCVDGPTELGLNQLELAVTNSRLVIVRFHGRNSRGWTTKGASVHERFSYLYSPEELQPWTARLKLLASRAEAVHATFNNCYRDYAVLNAKEMAALVREGEARAETPVASDAD